MHHRVNDARGKAAKALQGAGCVGLLREAGEDYACGVPSSGLITHVNEQTTNSGWLVESP